MPSRRDFLVGVAQAGVALSALRLPEHFPNPQPRAPSPLEVPIGLDWRMLGPFRGGRCDAVSGVPGRPDEFYFGHVNGGVWKTIDAGRTWLPIFDDQPVTSIGALAVARSEEHTSELQSRLHLVCRLLLEKKKNKQTTLHK